MSTRDGLWGFSTSNTIRLMSLNGGLLREARRWRPPFINVLRSTASRGRDFGAAAADDHRMLRLGDDPAADVEEGRIGHDGAGPNNGIQGAGVRGSNRWAHRCANGNVLNSFARRARKSFRSVCFSGF